MIKILILSIIILSIALIGLSVKLFFGKKAEFRGGCCADASNELKEKGIHCGCKS